MSIRRRNLIVAALAFPLTQCGAMGYAPADGNASRIRGTITSVVGTYIKIATGSGRRVTIAVPETAPVAVVAPARIEDIKPGSYIGTTAVPQPDGTLMAIEVHVFPESMRGVGEGFRPWDLQPESTMTNGTVGTVAGTSGRRLTVTYHGGEKTVVVPPQAQIVMIEKGSPALLVPGAHVIVFASPSTAGMLRAHRIAVGKDGLTPPM